jgi:hypothetical protein
MQEGKINMIVKTDANLYPLDETAKRSALQASATVNINADASGSATIDIPENEMWFIKSWTVTQGADVTVDSISIDGNDAYQTASVNDTLERYGAVINAESTVTINGSNAGLSAQSLGIQVDGYKIIL